MSKKPAPRLYRLIKWIVKTCYPKMTVKGLEHLPQEPVILVGNHAQMNGPIACELYAPGKHLKEVPAYAFQDFWSKKPKLIRWFYRLLSYIIAPLSVCVFNNANTIGVYHDTRILSTFKNTVARLQEGANVVIFPEHDVPCNHILCQFQEKFVDIAKLYHKRTGNALSFVPLYIAPDLKQMHLGAPIRFCPDNPMEQERQRICTYLTETITDIACALPAHRVVPYNNIPKRDYPSNRIPSEQSQEVTL